MYKVAFHNDTSISALSFDCWNLLRCPIWEVLLYQANIVSLSMRDISRTHLIKVKLYLKCTVNMYLKCLAIYLVVSGSIYLVVFVQTLIIQNFSL